MKSIARTIVQDKVNRLKYSAYFSLLLTTYVTDFFCWGRQCCGRNSTLFFTFFYIHEKKELDLRKFSTYGFRWIYTFWDVLNTIWSFSENVCLYVCFQKAFGHCISRPNARKYLRLTANSLWITHNKTIKLLIELLS